MPVYGITQIHISLQKRKIVLAHKSRNRRTAPFIMRSLFLFLKAKSSIE